MRPQRFQQFAIDAYRAAGIQAEPWSEDTKRPMGIALTLPTGQQIRHAITAQSREGEKYAEPEQPVEKEAPAPVAVPELGKGADPRQVEGYLAAVLNNSGSTEILRTYGYSDHTPPAMHPGFGVIFHSGARVFCMLS
ncbi:hypothetical protein [Streptomyces mayteni]